MSEEKRRAILDAALHVFAERGFSEARISDIAIAAGVGKGTVYLYFASKEDLLVGVLEFFADEAVGMIDAVDWVEGDPRAKLQGFLESLFARFAGNMELLSIMEQRTFLLNDALKARGQQLLRDMLGRIHDEVLGRLEIDGAEDYDMEILATATIGMLGSFSLYRVLHPNEAQDAVLARMAGELARFFAAALYP